MSANKRGFFPSPLEFSVLMCSRDQFGQLCVALYNPIFGAKDQDFRAGIDISCHSGHGLSSMFPAALFSIWVGDVRYSQRFSTRAYRFSLHPNRPTRSFRASDLEGKRRGERQDRPRFSVGQRCQSSNSSDNRRKLSEKTKWTCEQTYSIFLDYPPCLIEI